MEKESKIIEPSKILIKSLMDFNNNPEALKEKQILTKNL